MTTIRPLLFALALALAVPATAAAQSTRALFWTGLGLSTGGGVLSLIGGYGMRRGDCSIISVGRDAFLSCINKPHTGLMITGGSLAAAGSVLMIVGMNQSIAIGPRRLTYSRRF